MARTDAVTLRTAEELLNGFGIGHERAVLCARAAAILDDFSAQIQEHLQNISRSGGGAWLAFCREALARAYARHAREVPRLEMLGATPP